MYNGSKCKINQEMHMYLPGSSFKDSCASCVSSTRSFNRSLLWVSCSSPQITSSNSMMKDKYWDTKTHKEEGLIIGDQRLETSTCKPKSVKTCQWPPEARSKGFPLRDSRERTGLVVPWLLTFCLEPSLRKAVLSHPASLFVIESLERKYTLDGV